MNAHLSGWIGNRKGGTCQHVGKEISSKYLHFCESVRDAWHNTCRFGKHDLCKLHLRFLSENNIERHRDT